MLTVILSIGIFIFLGLLGSRAIKLIKLPSVTGYLLVGLLIGPSGINIVTHDSVSEISKVATPIILGLIAYMIGGNLPMSSLRGLKKNVLIITLFEGGCAWLFVLMLVTFIYPILIGSLSIEFNTALAMGVVIGAISLATAPAVTMAIIEETKAKGPMVATLLGVVALDNALAIIAFAISIGVCANILGSGESLSAIGFLAQQLIFVVFSILLGMSFGLILIGASRFVRNERVIIVLVVGMVLISSEVPLLSNIFPLLTNMVFGFVVVNLQKEGRNHVRIPGNIQELMFSLFFTLAGAHLDLSLIKSAGILSLLIVLGRDGGKFVGGRFGATVSGAPLEVRKYLSFALMPKAGVTLGLSMLVMETPQLEQISSLVVTSILASTLINELLTPPLSKFALLRAEKLTESNVLK